MLQGFRDFITRGNLIETAIALVMALATVALVNSLIESLVTPLIGAIVGEPSFEDLTFTINGSEFFYGQFINAVITFVSIGAAVYFFIVRPFEAFQARRGVRAQNKRCPHCLSSIPVDASRCAFCTEPV
jgi:large conductance mechanosensitive channel